MARREDVVIIGGGAVGLCAAWYLQEAGRQVSVLSRDPIGTGASCGNAGMICPSHIIPLSAPGVMAKGIRWLMNPESPFYIRPRLDADLAWWLWRFRASCTEAHVARSIPVLRDLALSGLDRFDALTGAVGDFGFARTGLLMAYHTRKGEEENLALADRAEAAGLAIERLDRAATASLQPGLLAPFEGAVLFRDDARIDPDAFIARLSAGLTARGASIRPGVTATDLEPGHSPVVHTSEGPIACTTVVVAAGAWSPRFGRSVGLRLPVEVGKGYSVTIPGAADGLTVPTILTEEKLTITPMPGRVRFGGTLSLTGLDPSVSPRRSQPIRRLANAYFPDASTQDVWAGFRPCSPDGLPIIGSAAPGIFVATGHGMLGITHAPTSGALVADLILGRDPVLDLAPLSPNRFR